MQVVERICSPAPGRLPALCLASLISLLGLCVASAQTTEVVVGDFSDLGGAETIIVVDDVGHATKGHLLRFSPDQLTMTVDGRNLVFDRQQVTTIQAVGDSLKNGMLIGLFTGIAIGSGAGLAAAECTGYNDVVRPCDDGEKLLLANVGGVLGGGAGLGIGTALDALMRNRRLVYHRAQASGLPAVSIVPALTPSGSKLLLTVTW